MNAPLVLSPLQSLALQIIEGDHSGLPKVDFPLWENADWRDGAEECLQGDGGSLLRFLTARQEAYQLFVDWVGGDYERREDADFANWLVNKARWNRPAYEAALTLNERKLVMVDAPMVLK